MEWCILPSGLPPEKKGDHDYIGMWDDREDIDSDQFAVDALTRKPLNFVSDDSKVPQGALDVI